MRFLMMAVMVLVPSLMLAQTPADDAIKALIAKLASANFQDRQAATKSLQSRPEAAAAVRQILNSSDAETRRRAAEILEYYDRRPVRDLSAAGREGKLDRFIEVLSVWPTGKYESEAWFEVRGLVRILAAIHQKKGGKKIASWVHTPNDWTAPMLSVKRATEATKCDADRVFFLRAEEVDIDRRRLNVGNVPKNSLEESAAIVARRTVRILTSKSRVIFAGGSIELNDGGEGISDSVIVSGADVTLNCHLVNSLVIARGKVTANGNIRESRIVSGKWVVTAKKPRDCIIEEEETNPLGLVRWAVSPKDERREEVQAAANQGQVGRFIERMAAWPAGKDDDWTWHRTRALAQTLTDLHDKKGGERIELWDELWESRMPPVFCAKRITETTKCEDDRLHFLRAGEVDLNPERQKKGEKPQNAFDHSPAIVATGAVRMSAWRSHVIFAGGPVELRDGGLGVADTVIVCGSDVTLTCDLANSLIIARGNVTCLDVEIKNCRIISGKSVVYTKKNATNCIITENEPNPLGYIRWSDTPKDKPSPKSK
jgi:hypothetical protein